MSTSTSVPGMSVQRNAALPHAVVPVAVKMYPQSGLYVMSMPVPGMKLRMSWHGDGTPLISMTNPVVDGKRHGSMVPFGPTMTKSPGSAGQPPTAFLRYSVQNFWFALSLRFAITDQMGSHYCLPPEVIWSIMSGLKRILRPMRMQGILPEEARR